MKFSFVIPTKDRPRELRALLSSIQAQSAVPDETIVVDGGDVPVQDVLREYPALSLKYLRVVPPSLTKQRNAGIRAVGPAMQLIAFFDDDIVMEPGSIEAMLAFWSRAPADVGGAVFNIADQPDSRAKALKTIFGIDAPQGGRVLKSGFNTIFCPARETQPLEWIFGGATVWRREVLENAKFDEWFDGYGYAEDLEFSYRVGKRWKLYVVAEARVRHLQVPFPDSRNYAFGQMQVLNRLYFVKKHPELSLGACGWALAGQLALNLTKGLLRANKGDLLRTAGNLSGLTRAALGRTNHRPPSQVK